MHSVQTRLKRETEWSNQTTDCGTLGIVSALHGVFGVVGTDVDVKSRRQAVGVGELALERWVKKS